MIKQVSMVIVLVMLGCSSGEESKPPPTPTEIKPSTPAVIKITTAVPYGKHVKCENIFPDVAKVAEITGLDIGRMADRSKSNSNMTSVCAFYRAGEPPKNNAQLKKFNKENRKLGILPGDEYCTISLNCSIAADPDSLKDRCERDRKTAEGRVDDRTEYEDDNSLGQYSCVRKTDRPPSDFAYTFKTVDPDTKCLLEVMGGPTVVSQELVHSCTKAGLAIVVKEGLSEVY